MFGNIRSVCVVDVVPINLDYEILGENTAFNLIKTLEAPRSEAPLIAMPGRVQA